MYHQPSPKVFEMHMQYLLRHYTVITLTEYVAAVRTHTVRRLPMHSVIITFDDGHRSNFDLLDIFKKYSIVPTIYVASNIVCSNRKFWWTIPQCSTEVEKIKLMPTTDAYRYLYEHYHYTVEDEYSCHERQALDEREMQAMSSCVDFQSHTSFHPILTRCTEEAIRTELYNSKATLERMLQKEIVHMSYPNGTYDERIMAIARDIGYWSARTATLGWNDDVTNLFALNIVGVSDKQYDHRFEIDLLGVPLFMITTMNRITNLFLK